MLQAVFRIRDILVRIQIRILGPVHLISDPDPDPALFVSELQGQQQIIFSKFFCLLLSVSIFTSLFKETSH
jgi:hypothetical protein